jgi:3-deoxy-D-manno-oct-2-ulosonic acid (Kdo) hydroxylase
VSGTRLERPGAVAACRALPLSSWAPERVECEQAQSDLEGGAVLFLPHLEFSLQEGERRFLSASWSDGRAKNISLDGAGGALSGALGTASDHDRMRRMMERFANAAGSLVERIVPSYRAGLERARTSFRPLAIERRTSSWRSDDSRLHVDAFPSRPTRGRRILRVFANLDPFGRPRVWRVGEPFDDLARRFLPQLRRSWPGSSWLLDRLGVTQGERSEYDHVMLQLHDLAKSDADLQSRSPQRELRFPPGSAWLLFSDQVVHAALSGQFALEQTFRLPVDALADSERAPLRVLERLLRRALV